MAKDIIVNADARESRIAVREDNQLVELHIEREERVVGSIYKGRVESVHHGMDASFVDIGLEKNAFLFAGDIVPGGGDTDENGDGDNDAVHDRRGRRPRQHSGITSLVKRGQEILVQVMKGPRGSKGARVTTRISLPGRYLVYMPEEASVGVSRKIEDSRERDRLKRIIEGIRATNSHGKPTYGLIVRTEAEGKTERELRQDLEFLERTWADIRQKSAVTPAPNLVYADLTLLFRILRDTFGQEVHRLILDSPDDYRRAHELLDFFGPALKDRVELYDGEKPIFEHFGIEQDIQRLLEKRVWLKSGGYLVIDQAEALVAIDVNSGRFTGQTTGLNDTIVQTNLEAVNEIARQLRLRDLGGIIVLDLIDMSNQADRKRVEVALEAALNKDKARWRIGHISPMGLMEMTRKRTGEAVNEQMTEACPYCTGLGKIAAPDTVAINIQRDLRRLSKIQGGDAFLVRCHPHVASHLVGEDGEEIEALEHLLQRGIYVRVDEKLHQEKYEIQPGKMDDFDRRQLPYHRGQVVEVTVMRGGLATAPAATAYTSSGYLVHLEQGARFVGAHIRVRLVRVGRSSSTGELMTKGGDNPPANAPTPPPALSEPPRREDSPGGNAPRNGNNRNRRNRNRQRDRQPA
ncbi:MAG: Rne/Rng family ribonuclease [Capsulimonadales bacterium]|nr:Rne/Rng family ribonuclease [Capsulimonadales bacterium]